MGKDPETVKQQKEEKIEKQIQDVSNSVYLYDDVEFYCRFE